MVVGTFIFSSWHGCSTVIQGGNIPMIQVNLDKDCFKDQVGNLMFRGTVFTDWISSKKKWGRIQGWKFQPSGDVVIANDGAPDKNGCQFYITDRKASWLNGKDVDLSAEEEASCRLLCASWPQPIEISFSYANCQPPCLNTWSMEGQALWKKMTLW